MINFALIWRYLKGNASKWEVIEIRLSIRGGQFSPIRLYLYWCQIVFIEISSILEFIRIHWNLLEDCNCRMAECQFDGVFVANAVSWPNCILFWNNQSYRRIVGVAGEHCSAIVLLILRTTRNEFNWIETGLGVTSSGSCRNSRSFSVSVCILSAQNVYLGHPISFY